MAYLNCTRKQNYPRYSKVFCKVFISARVLSLFLVTASHYSARPRLRVRSVTVRERQ